MKPINPIISHPLGHVHCSYLHVLCLTGIPGFAIIAAFLFLLVKRMILLFFSTSPEAGIAVKVLVILLTCVFLYNVLDSSLFYDFDIRSIVPFIISGAVIAYSKDSINVE